VQEAAHGRHDGEIVLVQPRQGRDFAARRRRRFSIEDEPAGLPFALSRPPLADEDGDETDQANRQQEREHRERSVGWTTDGVVRVTDDRQAMRGRRFRVPR
jgi:hypothetical protein